MSRRRCKRGHSADEAVLNVYVGERMNRAQRAVEIARELDDPALLARTLSACGYIAGARYDAETAATYFAQAHRLGPGTGRPMDVEPDPRLAGQHGADHR